VECSSRTSSSRSGEQVSVMQKHACLMFISLLVASSGD
jgi:hypothetical protein